MINDRMPSKSGSIYIHRSAKKKQKAEKIVSDESDSGKLRDLEHRAGLIIFEAASVRPFLLSNKDKITICPNRVTVSNKTLFTSEEHPMPIENITGARIYRHFMFASLIIDTFGVQKPDPVDYMRVNDARLARRYILALIECKKSNIDLTGMDLGDLRKVLKSIGMVRFSTSDDSYHDI
jgi:hypothetical protein